MTPVLDQPLAAERPQNAQKLLQPGTNAPDFSLSVTPDRSLRLSDLAGKPVILAFYPRLESGLRRSARSVQ
jgi:AhpC/TSA family